jgi:hypothetical protein
MKKISIVILILGISFTIFCIFYYKLVLDVVDSDTMTVKPGGEKVSEWPLFIGIYTTFVGATFFYASLTERKHGGQSI